MAKYYITTTAPYVNAEPHIGFALEIIQADVLARYHLAIGDEVFFNTGTDEHGKKIYEKAIENGKTPQEYVDEYAVKFDLLKNALNLSYNSFWRSTNKEHIEAAQEIWKRVKSAGYIEKGIYKAKYCVGCELEKQDSELVGDRCPLHPNKELEIIEEENYFFKFSAMKDKLLEYYDSNQDFVVPCHRQREIRNFVAFGLTDFSVSRLAAKMPWGVPVPDDPRHVMYVWFDALTYYISALGWPKDEVRFLDYWGTTEKPNAIQVAGKDNLRQQTAMWQAMLSAAGLAFSKQILIHGFITSDGQKMSKSLGNVVDPLEYVREYGTDALRYYLLAKISPFEDSDFTRDKFDAAYVADLQNGLGNLVSRIATMAAGMDVSKLTNDRLKISATVTAKLEEYLFDEAMKDIWERINNCNVQISEKRVWEMKSSEREDELIVLINQVRQIACDLGPFLPQTAKRIEQVFEGKIDRTTPLFPRLGRIK